MELYYSSVNVLVIFERTLKKMESAFAHLKKQFDASGIHKKTEITCARNDERESMKSREDTIITEALKKPKCVENDSVPNRYSMGHWWRRHTSGSGKKNNCAQEKSGK